MRLVLDFDFNDAPCAIRLKRDDLQHLNTHHSFAFFNKWVLKLTTFGL